MLGAVDFFLPYFPLEASNLQDLFAKHLTDQAEKLQRSDAANMTWSSTVIGFLLSKVCLIPTSHAVCLLLHAASVSLHSVLQAATDIFSFLTYVMNTLQVYAVIGVDGTSFRSG